jgi:putative transposase
MPDDTGLLDEIRAHVAGLPSYGYRRIWALLRRSREMVGAPCVDHKRVYRVMCEHQLLLRRPGVRRDKLRHDGRVAVDRSDTLGVRMASSSDVTMVNRCV